MSFYDAIRVGASGASGDLEIQRSLRFNSDDTAYLNRTPSSAGNRKTFTISLWIKRGNLGDVRLIACHSGNSDTGNFELDFVNDSFRYIGWSTQFRVTNRKFRDPSAWYHIVTAIDTTDSTADDRIKIYVNGVQETSFSTSNNPSQDFDTGFNQASTTRIGLAANSIAGPFDGYMAEVNFIDGQALTPASFGATNALTGQWNPKKYAGSYGTNGFRLTFEDNSNNAALGTDTSGNGNTFTVNNISSSHDTLIDTPSNNFCVFNELNRTNDANLTDGNLAFTQSSNDESVTGTFGIDSGKWYWEVYKKSTENPELGIDTNLRVLSNKTDDVSPTKVCFRTNGGDQQVGTGTPTSITGSSGGQTGAGVIRIAVDFDNKKIWYSDLSGNFFNSGNPATGSNAAFDFSSVAVANGCVPYFFCGTGANDSIFVNFGADSAFGGNLTGSEVQSNTDGNGNGLFKYSVPSGYLALCSANLPDPTILLPNKHFETKTYVGGDGSAVTISLDFSPDWTWLKSRSSAADHGLYDTVRGVNQRLRANSTGAEDTVPGPIVSNTGFTLNGSGYYNPSSGTPNMISWNWNAGDTDSKTYTVKVVSDSGNKYRFDDFGTSAVTLDLAEGGTYIFDQSDSSNAGHPLRFSTTSNGTHGGGSEYTTGVTTAGTPGSSGAYTQIVVAASAPTLYYYCSVHSGMGGQANTNSTLGSSNFDGTIQSTVKVNATAGFSIVRWTGNGSSGATIGHGLGVTPNFAFAKNRSSSSNWATVNFDLQIGSQLNETQVFSNGNYNAYYAGQPTSSVLTLGNHGTTNTNGDNYVAYVFSEVAGYSKFGSYTANQNDNGPFVFTGFRPAWILLKSVGNIFGGGSPFSGGWYIIDTKRSTFNVVAATLAPHNANAEDTGWGASGIMDILSNGFKIRTDGLAINATLSGSYVYLAFAESPYKNSRAR